MKRMIICLAILLLTACAAEPPVGQVVPLALDTTVTGMQTVLNRGFGTFILEGEKYVLLAWPDRNNYNYVILDKASATPIKDLIRCCEGRIGNQTGQWTMADLVKYLREEKDYKYVPEPPEHIRIAIQHAIQWFSMNWGASMPTFFVIPIGPLMDGLPQTIRT